MNLYYVDASTYRNGKPGQQSKIAIHDGSSIIFERHLGNKTINEAEIMAIFEAIRIAGGQPCCIFSDSQLAVKILRREWQAKMPHLRALRDSLVVPDTVQLTWIPRSQNLAGHYFESQQSFHSR